MHGCWGRLLHIDLSGGRFAFRSLEQTRLRQYLGGVGLGTSLLYEYAPPGVDPLEPANALIFASAPLVGTGLTTTAKFAVVTKSPLTGFIADSLSSSHFALELKRLGIDALVITGRAVSLAYVFIEGDRVEIRPAEHLRGVPSADLLGRIRTETARPSAWIASIGAAGEHGVRFATISNEGRHAGRGGIGAVMGSKNLKAVAVAGSLQTPVAHPQTVATLASALRRRSLGTVTAKYRQLGTVANLAVFDRLGVLPTRNFTGATFEGADALSGETLTTSSFSRRNGCASCTIRCERLFTSAGGHEQRLEYETLFALGPLCGIDDPAHVLEAARLCDELGLDSISAGGTLAWAIEAGARGLPVHRAGMAPRFGDGHGLLESLRRIGIRSGDGDLLAEGSRRAAAAIGHGSGAWAMHVKGLELPGYEPRSLKTMALGLAVSPRGACHNRSGAYEADFSGAVDRLHGDAGRGPIVAASEDFAAVLDSLVVCKFLRKCFTDFYPEAAALLSAVTGWEYSGEELVRAGERIHTLKKLFNIREGWRRTDDWLPERLLQEPVTTGVARGVRLTPDELREMIDSYYLARGWDQDGLVPTAKLASLGIAPAAPRTTAPACPG